ncbi:heavy metal translocating P-type ATPase [Noviherbaspirillum aridicola]|uniref:Cation-transporting P-type ATPase n=1 Tax=Noviherbaspirillum aridicola TaxID=2849687 RepID=A0ABQ4Q3R1_9BURK|nr:heavy metal translocating P-type ATPase [Noviherbaspirillum aridicola]GIZ51677.1 cation-transporting P-type ATPase [Noviherbaspirillum aridicola]
MGENASCFHCGLPVPAGSSWSVRIADEDRAMCCPGCEAVARTIVDNGLSAYYLNREGYSSTGDESLVPEELRLYDTPEVMAQYGTAGDGQQCDALFSVEGIRCAACVWLIERRLARVPGVQKVNLNVATERLQVQWRQDRCKPSDILAAVREVGYAAYPFDAARHDAQLRKAEKTLFRQVFIAGLSMMQVMMYAVPVYMATDGTMDADMEKLMEWASLLLTLPAVFYSALPFFRGAWANLRARALGMDVPVALGIAAAFGGSLAATFSGSGDVYYDSVTMFIFLLLCSRYLELMARRKAASALERLQHAMPASASRMKAYPADRGTSMVPAAQLAEGDFVLVKPGEAVPADGVIVEGSTAIDLSLLTGESRPQPHAVGDRLPGGAVNATQAIVVRIAKPVGESTLSTLVKLIERAGQAKPQLSLWADKVAAWFVAALLVFAVAIFFAWQWIDPSRAWPIAIAVLVVSCPCALSLATPSALAAATDRLVRQGVLVVQPHVLETLHRTTHVVFDKTGTLTLGRPALRATTGFAAHGEAWYLRAAAALEAGSAHPLAHALIEAAARQAGAPLKAVEVVHRAGQGLEGMVEGLRLRLGSESFVAELTGAPPPALPEGYAATPVWLGTAHGWLARFDLEDALRADARDVVAHFRKRNKQVILLSGDQQAVTARIAAELGIPVALGEQLPDQKLAYVQDLQKQGAVVAMVGDGINDAAVLRAADVSFAMGGGAALAQTHADTVLLSGQLHSVADADQAAQQTMAVIRQNLTWATLYNLLAIPAAAVGLLNPWLSGIGMSLSSAVVVINALRLRRIPRAARLRADAAVAADHAGLRRQQPA